MSIEVKENASQPTKIEFQQPKPPAADWVNSLYKSSAKGDFRFLDELHGQLLACEAHGQTWLSKVYRGLVYLYAPMSYTYRLVGPSPAADLIALAVHSTCLVNGRKNELDITIDKVPKKYPLLFSKNELEEFRYDEYAEIKHAYGKQPVRILGNPATKNKIVEDILPTLALMAETWPEKFFEDLAETVYESGTLDTIGILEWLNNYQLLDQGRFAPLSRLLRASVFIHGGLENYEQLKERYHYSAINNAAFWLEGEKTLAEFSNLIPQTFSYARQTMEVFETQPEPLSFPQLGHWYAKVKEINSLLKRIEQLTPANITRSSLGQTGLTPSPESRPAKITSYLLAGKAENEDANLSLRALRKHLFSDYKNRWEQVIFAQIKEQPAIDLKRLKSTLHTFVNASLADPRLSQKAHLYLDNLSQYYQENSNFAYSIKDELFQEPLFAWLGSTPASRHLAETLLTDKQAAINLYKLMITRLLNHAFNTKAHSFLFSNSSADQALFERLAPILEDLATSTDEIHDPDPRAKICRWCLVATTSRRQEFPQFYDKKFLKSTRRHWDRLKKNRFGFYKSNIHLAGRKETANTVKILTGSIIVGGLIATGLDRAVKLLPQLPSERSEAESDLSIFLGDQKNDGSAAEQLARQIFPFAKIIHMPAGLKAHEGQPYAYFPYDQPGFTDVESKPLKPNENLFFVDNIDSQAYTKNEQAYMPLKVTDTMYIPTGYRLVHIIQEGSDSIPSVGGMGQIYYHGQNLPRKVVLVIEPLKPTLVHDRGRLVIYEGVTTPIYYLPENFNYQQALKLNQEMADDPKLQEIHRHFIDSIHTATQESKTKDELRDKVSYITLSSLDDLTRYIDQQRYYALDFQVFDDLTRYPDYPYLDAVTDKKDQGYYCAVAAGMVADFLKSGGVIATRQGGLFIKVGKNGILEGRITHATDVVHLPNGQVIFFDGTPNAGDKTPQSDLEALEWPAETKTPVKTSEIPPNYDWLIKQSLTVVGGLTGVIAVSGGLIFSGRKLEDFSEKQRINKALKILSTPLNLSPVEKRAIAANLYQLANLRFDTNYSKKIQEQFDDLIAVDLPQTKEVLERLLEDTQFLLTSKEDSQAVALANHPKLHNLPSIQTTKLIALANLINDSERKAFNQLVSSSLSPNSSGKSGSSLKREIVYKTKQIEDLIITRLDSSDISSQNAGYLGKILAVLKTFSTGSIS